MSDVLLELFSEEIPARMQAEALAHLQKMLLEGLHKEQLAVTQEQVRGFVTPRRLGICITGLAERQSASEQEIKGPKLGAPEAALQGFLKKNGLTAADLIERDGTYFALIRKAGRNTADMLKPLIETILLSFPWPKSMRWGSGELRWVRPLHSIICLFGDAVVPVAFAGVTASNVTYGHRFLSPQAITISHPSDYETALKKAYVSADRDRRKQSIVAQAEQAAATLGLQVKKDDALLEEVTGLVEWPVVLVGKIDAPFMALPPEVLTTVMRAHQKYFALENTPSPMRGEGWGGGLSPHFLIISNMQASDGGKAIIAGNERVLRARFADAQFFWDQDRKKPLAEWAEGLKTVTFHAKLGTVADKVERIKQLAIELTDYVPGADQALAERAASLCKADLVTGMVGEFAELQGVMGRYYALAQSEQSAIADAIRDHYKPQGPNDSVPTQPISICTALADKFDTLVSLFAVGEKPTGSKDPFALRRAALGIIRIVLINELRLPLTRFVPGTELLSFFADRLKIQLKEQHIRHDIINAIVADNDDDLVRITRRAVALQEFLSSNDGANLLVAYRRAANILAIEEKKDNCAYSAADLESGQLQEPEEITLANLLAKQKNRIGNLRENEHFADAMTELATLRQPVDLFFDKVLVNCDNKDLRANRLRLLAFIKAGMDSIANFSKLEG